MVEALERRELLTANLSPNFSHFTNWLHDQALASGQGYPDFSATPNQVTTIANSARQTVQAIHGTGPLGKPGDSPVAVTGPLTVDEVSTPDSKELVVSYDVAGQNTTPFRLDVYRSDSASPNAGHQVKIAEEMLSGSQVTGGHHTIVITAGQFLQSQALRPDPTHHFVVATLDDNGALNPADAAKPPGADFRIWLVASVTHGYTLSVFGPPPAQTWVDTMARSLVTEDHYDAALAYHWETDSQRAAPGWAVVHGQDMDAKLEALAASLHPGRDDVVDVHFIGHSRGTVVISQALVWLEANPSKFPLLKAGFMEMTLLDPHPANGQTTPLVDYARTGLTGALAGIALQQYTAFQSAANDPDVVIPANVQQADEYYQHTRISQGLSGDESVLNVWGEVVTSSGVRLQLHNQTGWGVGHGEIHSYYQKLIDGGQKPYKPF